MLKYLFSIVLLSLTIQIADAQINIEFLDPVVEPILKGDYDPATYAASQPSPLPATLIDDIQANISADSMKGYLLELQQFGNRNSGSDTTSLTNGIGAARNWVHQKFQSFADRNENRLIPTFLQFEANICDVGLHRNVVAVLPGRDTSDASFVLIEGHMDSRCADVCDIDCPAEGMEDNGSGTALVIELARVMSQYTFDHTLVFMATTGEEQGLVGASAFARKADREDMLIKAVLNNDIVGGIICGETSSPPSCPGFNHVDSTQVRMFSSGNIFSPHKSLARFVKKQYADELVDEVAVPMMLTIMSAEDRTGRGGDHLPFSLKDYPAIRFTSANEHGNADASDPDYHDRQHTSDDILGVDTDGDNVLDSFFVDFNYLARNATINAVSAAILAVGPQVPAFDIEEDSGVATITITDDADYNKYLIGIRTVSNDFDTLIRIEDTKTYDFIPRETGRYYLSVCSIDENELESCFSEEQLVRIRTTGTMEITTGLPEPSVELLQNRPNPFDEATYIGFMVNERIDYKKAYVVILTLDGREIQRISAVVKPGLNEVLYTHGYNVMGTFLYGLEIDGQLMGTKQMVFAN